MKTTKRHLLALSAGLALAALTGGAHAQTALDDVMKAKAIKIAVPTDFPPYGFVGIDLQAAGSGRGHGQVHRHQAGREGGAGAGDQRQPHPLPADQEGRPGHLHPGQEPRAREGDRLHHRLLALLPGGVRGQVAAGHLFADLAGKSVGVTRGAIEDQELSKVAPATADIKRFEDNNATVSAFVSGQVQAIATGASVAGNMMARNPQLNTEYKLLLKDSPNFIGVAKGEDALRTKVNEIIPRPRSRATSTRWRRSGSAAPPAPCPNKHDPHAPPLRGSLPPEGADSPWGGPAANRVAPSLRTCKHAHRTRLPGRAGAVAAAATGVAWTLGLTAVSAVLGVALGVACAWARSHGPVWLRWVVGTYVELIRNTPFIVQLFFVFFGLPAAGVKLTPELASVIAMVINLGAYAAEIVRAGIEATPKGQFEAAASLALSQGADLHPRGAAAGAAQGVAGAHQPDHHRHAGLGGVRPDRDRGAELRGQPDPEPQLPRLRGLHRRHRHLPAAVHRRARAAELAGPRFILFAEVPVVDFSLWDILRNLLLAARWTVALSLVAFIGGGLVGMALLVARTARWPGARPSSPATCSSSRARRC
jgi:polar amino acid transport system substrate-binding protein